MQIGPHGGETFRGIGGQLGEQTHLTALDFLDDRQEQIFSRTEVVQQHSVAGADGTGHLAQRTIADAAVGELVDQRVEELPAAFAEP